MKRGLIFALLATGILASCNHKPKREMKCLMTEKTVNGNSEVTHYYYDNNNRIAAMVNTTAAAEMMPATKDSEVFIYNDKGWAEKDIILNSKTDTAGYETFDRDENGKITKTHVFQKKSKDDKTFSELTYLQLDHVTKNHLRATNYYMKNGQFSPVHITDYYINDKGNIDSARNSATENDSNAKTVIFRYDDKINSTYLEVYYGDPVNDNVNNVTEMKVKGADGQVHNTATELYEYNKEGYPVKITEKLDGTTGSVTAFTYNCR